MIIQCSVGEVGTFIYGNVVGERALLSLLMAMAMPEPGKDYS